MSELWKSANFTYKECPGVPGMVAWRCTTVQSGDTLTIPCRDIIAHVEEDETTANVQRVVKTSATVLTITCTNDDNISGIAIIAK